MRISTLLTALVALATALPASNAQDLSEVELGRQFLYCGKLTMHLLQLQGRVEGDAQKYKAQEKNAYTKMLMTAGAYLPEGSLNNEAAAIDTRLSSEIRQAAEQETTTQGSTGRFLMSRYTQCQDFDKKHGLIAFQRFAAGAAAKRASAAASSASAAN